MGFAIWAKGGEGLSVARTGAKREVEPLWAPRVYPATNLVFARNNRASTASLVAKFGINKQDWTEFSTNDLELHAEREGII